MFLIKCWFLINLLIVFVYSATLHEKIIPVEVRYENNHDISSNLKEKVQLSPEEFTTIARNQDHSENLIKNLDEKVQLSPEELLQASKHIPIQNLNNNEEEEVKKNLPETNNNKISVIEQVETSIGKALEKLRKNFQPKDNELAPSAELWDNLAVELKDYFTEEKNKVGSRQDSGSQQQNIFQNLAQGVQQITNNFLETFQNQQRPQQPQNGTSGDEASSQQPSNPMQGFFQYFTGGFQNVVSNIQNQFQNAAPNSTVLGDSEQPSNSQQPPNIFGNFVNGVSQIFSFNNRTQAGGNNGTNGQGFFAGAVNQINQAVGSIIPTASETSPPTTQGNEQAGTINGGNPIQQVFQGFGTAFNQLIQGNANRTQQQQQQQQQGSEDENTNQQPNQNFIQNIGQNIGNALQNIQNQFIRPPSSSLSNLTLGNNPITDAASQIQPIIAANNPIQNLIPSSLPSTNNHNTTIISASSSDAKDSIIIPENDDGINTTKEVMTAIE